MIFDTDVLIWAFHGNENAQKKIDKTSTRFVSSVTYMELLQGARNRKEQLHIKNFLKLLNFSVLPITENICHRATIFVEEYALSGSVYLADALIFATACEHRLKLCSGNKKHFKSIVGLSAQAFNP